jgi:GTPase SAR1 family protein
MQHLQPLQTLVGLTSLLSQFVKNKFDGWASTEIAPYYTTVEYELGRDMLS